VVVGEVVGPATGTGNSGERARATGGGEGEGPKAGGRESEGPKAGGAEDTKSHGEDGATDPVPSTRATGGASGEERNIQEEPQLVVVAMLGVATGMVARTIIRVNARDTTAAERVALVAMGSAGEAVTDP
jgi:hypothetical protein